MPRQTDTIINLLVEGSTKVIQKMMLDIQADLATQTPVDTGWAANNWLTSVGVPMLTPAGSREDVDFTSASVGLEGILLWNIESGVPIYIVNNVPYINSLNAGSSRKAPARFVDKIIQTRVEQANRKDIK